MLNSRKLAVVSSRKLSYLHFTDLFFWYKISTRTNSKGVKSSLLWVKYKRFTNIGEALTCSAWVSFTARKYSYSAKLPE